MRKNKAFLHSEVDPNTGMATQQPPNLLFLLQRLDNCDCFDRYVKFAVRPHLALKFKEQGHPSYWMGGPAFFCKEEALLPYLLFGYFKYLA